MPCLLKTSPNATQYAVVHGRQNVLLPLPFQIALCCWTQPNVMECLFGWGLIKCSL
jgi:hypothetical protein